MANAVTDGAKSAGNVDVALEYHVQADELDKFDAIVVGVPTYHHEMPFGIKQIFEEAAEKGISLKEKIGAAFGSYGWSGEDPKLVLEILKNKLKMQVIETPVLARDEPNQISLNACRNLGKRISETLNRRT